MRHTNLVSVEVVQKGIVVMVALDHDAVEFAEFKVDPDSVSEKDDAFIGGCCYKKAVIWYVVGRFEGLDGKIPYLSFESV